MHIILVEDDLQLGAEFPGNLGRSAQHGLVRFVELYRAANVAGAISRTRHPLQPYAAPSTAQNKHTARRAKP